jgi:hypothetical protein
LQTQDLGVRALVSRQATRIPDARGHALG